MAKGVAVATSGAVPNVMYVLSGTLIFAAMLDIEWRSAGGLRATPGHGHLDEVK